MNSNAAFDLAESTSQGLLQNQPYSVETRVWGTDEVGFTHIDEEGKGIYVPRPLETVLPSSTAIVKKVATSASGSLGTISVDDLYPQWEEKKADAGIAIRFISKAIDDLQQVIESPQPASIEALNYLVLAETQLFQALPKSRFNKAFEIVVSSCAWGLRNVGMSKSAPSFQGMCSVLREIKEHPFLAMDRATKLILDLEDQGWSDESEISQAFQSGLAAADDEQGWALA